MPTRVVQLGVNFLPSFASVDPADISYEIVSDVDTVRVEETGEGVRGDGNGSFSADVAIDDTWHPCRVIWYGPGRSISWPIDPPAAVAVEAAKDELLAAIDEIEGGGGPGEPGERPNLSIDVKEIQIG